MRPSEMGLFRAKPSKATKLLIDFVSWSMDDVYDSGDIRFVEPLMCGHDPLAIQLLMRNAVDCVSIAERDKYLLSLLSVVFGRGDKLVEWIEAQTYTNAEYYRHKDMLAVTDTLRAQRYIYLYECATEGTSNGPIDLTRGSVAYGAAAFTRARKDSFISRIEELNDFFGSVSICGGYQKKSSQRIDDANVMYIDLDEIMRREPQLMLTASEIIASAHGTFFIKTSYDNYLHGGHALPSFGRGFKCDCYVVSVDDVRFVVYTNIEISADTKTQFNVVGIDEYLDDVIRRDDRNLVAKPLDLNQFAGKEMGLTKHLFGLGVGSSK